MQNENDGGLLGEIPTPVFNADAGHRIKVFEKSLFDLVSKRKIIDEVKTIDALRLKNYYSLYFSQKRVSLLKFLSEMPTPPPNTCLGNTTSEIRSGVG